MTVLSDRDILAALESGWLTISPYLYAHLQPASYDLTLSDTFWRDVHGAEYVTVCGVPYELPPGGFVLGATEESVRLPADLVGVVSGKSTLGRLGLQVECAGWVDPGFRGQLTLELVNLSARPIQLKPGMAIAQISFQRLSSPAYRPYGTDGLGSRYQGQSGPTPARMQP